MNGCYLHSAFSASSNNFGEDISIADSGASYHMTKNNANMCDVRPHPPNRELISTGDGRNVAKFRQ